MQTIAKARFLFVVGLLVFLMGLLPILKTMGLSFLNAIPSEGMAYNVIIAALGLGALIISISKEW